MNNHQLRLNSHKGRFSSLPAQYLLFCQSTAYITERQSRPIDGKLNRRYRNAISSEAFNLATVTITLNILFSITASLGNTLILIALRKVTSLHSPTKLLFQCLAITDLGVGLISQPLYAIYNMFLINFNLKLWNITFILYDITWASSICLCSVSLLTTTGLSLDRLLALLLKLRYRHVVTLKRVRAVVFCFWLIALSSNFMFLLWDTNIA